jgi:hypothetical protein
MILPYSAKCEAIDRKARLIGNGYKHQPKYNMWWTHTAAKTATSLVGEQVDYGLLFSAFWAANLQQY